MKFSIKEFFSKYDQIRSFQRIWSHLLMKSLMENFIFCAVSNILRKSLLDEFIFSDDTNLKSAFLYGKSTLGMFSGNYSKILQNGTVRKVSKCGVFFGLNFPVLSPNIGKCGPEKTSYLDTFHAVPEY